MTAPSPSTQRAGLLYGLAAHGLWGLIPLYFIALGDIRPLELLAHRVVWCFVVLAAIVTGTGGWPSLFRALRAPSTRLLLVASGVFIGVNWFLFIYSVETKQLMHSSLGYFINPLFNVVLGLLIFRERLRLWQWVAVAIAATGLGYFIYVTGELPWLALSLALTFAMYGLIRKVTPVDGMQGLMVETSIWLPPALGYVLYLSFSGTGLFLTKDRQLDGLLLASGLVTAVPLLCFGQAARRLPLTTLGFLQYIAPSMQFLIAYYVLEEKKTFGVGHLTGFVIIWIALVVFSVDSLIAAQRRRAVTRAVPPLRQEPATYGAG